MTEYDYLSLWSMSNAPGLTAKKPSKAISWKQGVFFVPQRFRECVIATSTVQYRGGSFKVALMELA
ncbi:hypothetical protein ABN584_26460 [Gloeocapsa sp. BRSZ]